MRDDWEQIGRNIARNRKSRGMSQAALAQRLRDEGLENWHQNTVSRVEQGKQQIRPGDLMRLERILGGGLLEGTTFGRTIQGVVDSSQRALTMNGLREALAALDKAAAAVSDLLVMWGEEEDHPEVDDGEHPETS